MRGEGGRGRRRRRRRGGGGGGGRQTARVRRWRRRGRGRGRELKDVEKEGRNEVGRDGSDGNRVRGKKVDCHILFHCIIHQCGERVTQRNRGGRRGWQGKEKMEKDRQASRCRHRRKWGRRMRKAKKKNREAVSP